MFRLLLAACGGSLTGLARLRKVAPSRGAIAQLGERLHGMQEVGGSIPPSSTKTATGATPANDFLRPHRLEAQDTALSRR